MLTVRIAATVATIVSITAFAKPARSEDGSEELAKKLSNPIASLISVRFQLNWDQGYGSEGGDKAYVNAQLVIPFSLLEPDIAHDPADCIPTAKERNRNMTIEYLHGTKAAVKRRPAIESHLLSKWFRKIRTVASAVAPLAVAAILTVSTPASVLAQAQGFKFVAYGDSRSMMYLPYGKSDLDKIYASLASGFALILGEKVAEEIIKTDVKITFDPTTGGVDTVEMPFITKSEVARLTFEDGWVTEASVEDTKLAPGVETVMYRNYGGDWVGNQVAREVVDGGAAFVVNSGDVVWWGGQGKTLEDSPYWQRMNRLLLSKLPPVDDEMRAAGLEGRYFPSVGNHEVWEDPQIEGVLSAAPYLAKLGVSSEKLIYTYDFRDTRFIFLWTGKADRFAPSGWDATRPVYQEQLAQLVTWLDDAKAKGIRNVFVVFHNPVYNRSGFEPIPEDTNPHATLASYAKDFAELVVFNGHVHTTETFDVDGVKYVVMGGGGAEQDPILPGRTAIPRPDGYPQDLYWQGQPPKEEYNYLVVEVSPGKPSVFRLNRFRPWSSTPFEEVKLFETGN